MTHDYAKKSRRKKKAKSQVPGWVWLLTGIVTGVFVSFLVYLSDIKPVPAPKGILPEISKPTPVTTEKTSSTVFGFYTILPEREIIIPEQQTNASDHKQSTRYILQAGSFRNSGDADRLRARLILLGLDANTEAVTVSGGDIWHRVQVGPFSSRSKMAKARNTLISNDIDTLLFKKKIEG